MRGFPCQGRYSGTYARRPFSSKPKGDKEKRGEGLPLRQRSSSLLGRDRRITHIDGLLSRDSEDRDGTVDQGSNAHRDVAQLSSAERSSELFLREDGAQVLRVR